MESFFSFSHQKRWITFFSLFLLVCVLAQKGSCEFDSFESYNDAYVFSPQSVEMMESELVMPNSFSRTGKEKKLKQPQQPQQPQPPTVTPQLPSLPVAKPPEQLVTPLEKTAKRASSKNQKVPPQKRDTVESASLYSSLSNSSLESEMNSRRLSSFYEPYSSRSVPVSSMSVPSSRSISSSSPYTVMPQSMSDRSSPYTVIPQSMSDRSSPYTVIPQSMSDRSSSSSYSEMSQSSPYSVMSQSTNESRTPQFMDENFAEPRYLQGYYGYGYGYGYPYYRGYYRYPYGYGGYYRSYRPYGYYRRLDGAQVQGMVPAEMDEFPYQRDQPFQQFYPNAYPRNEFDDRRMKEMSQKNKVESASVNDSRMRKLGFGMGGIGQVGLDIGEMGAMSQMGENLMRGNAGGALGDFAMMEGMNAMSGGGGMGGMGALGAMEMGAMAMNLRRLKQNESKEPTPMRRMRTRQVETPYSESQNAMEQSNPMNVVNPYETANPMETVRPVSMQEVCASSPELCRRNEVSDYRRNEMEEQEERERQAERRMKMFPSYTSELESEE